MPLKIIIPPFEIFDEASNSFISEKKEVIFKLENSLHAIALWEENFKKLWFPKKKINPYQSNEDYAKEVQHSPEEMNYFIKCMIIGADPDEIDDKYIIGMGEKNIKRIYEYLQDHRSGLVLPPPYEDKKKKKKNERPLSSEVLYAYMSELQIPWEAQYWNVNRLMNVIQIISEDNTPEDSKKKRKFAEQANQMKEWDRINQERQKLLGTKG